jgi:hypothetical protein
MAQFDSSSVGARRAALMAGLDELVRRVEAKVAATAKEDADAERLFAERARNGELGADWKVVQRDIDGGRTTLGAVMSGQDGSPAATRIRDLAGQNMRAISSQWRQQREANPDDETNPLAGIASLNQDMAALKDRAEALRERIWL